MAHFGFHINSFDFPDARPGALFDVAAGIALTAEAAGFDSLWLLDHVIQGGHAGHRDEPILEPYTLLGALAARTSRVRLGTLVTGVTFRKPSYLAKVVTTLDVVSGGRAVLGIGAAWNEEEHLAYGYDFPPVKERLDRLEDALRICTAMFRNPISTVEGHHDRVVEARNIPQPVQPGGPKVLVGGGGERRTLRLVARYADMCNLPKHTDPAITRRKLDVLARYCDEAGRDPDAITKTRKRQLVLGRSRAEVWRKSAAQRARWGETRKAFRGMVIAGTVDSVVDQVGEDLAEGFDGVIFSMQDAHDLELVGLAGEALRRAFPARPALDAAEPPPLAVAAR